MKGYTLNNKINLSLYTFFEMVNYYNGSGRHPTTLINDKNLIHIDSSENKITLSDDEYTIIYDNVTAYPLGRIKIEDIQTKNNGNIEAIGKIIDVNIKNIKIIYRSLFDFTHIPYNDIAKPKGRMLHIFIMNILTRYDVEEINKILAKENINNCMFHVGSYLKCYDIPLHMIKRINTQIIADNINALNSILVSTPLIAKSVDDLIANQLNIVDIYDENNLLYLSYENTLVTEKRLKQNPKVLCGDSFTYLPNKDEFIEGEQKEKNSITSKDLKNKFIKNEPLPLWVVNEKSAKFAKHEAYASHSPSLYIIYGYDMSSNRLVASTLKQILIEPKISDAKIIDGQFMLERLVDTNKDIGKSIHQVLKLCERNIFNKNDVILILRYDDEYNKILSDYNDLLMFKSIVVINEGIEIENTKLEIDNCLNVKNTPNSTINLILLKALIENTFN